MDGLETSQDCQPTRRDTQANDAPSRERERRATQEHPRPELLGPEKVVGFNAMRAAKERWCFESYFFAMGRFWVMLT